jgi:phosphopantetheinyl transferase
MLFGLLRLSEELPTPLHWTPEEEARFLRMGSGSRAAQYRAGRWLLRRLCSEVSGHSMDEFSLNAEGAPVAGCPCGTARPFLSLAHSGDWVAATASYGPVAVDLERRGSSRDWAGLGKALDLPAPHGEEEILNAWTLREARIKAGAVKGLGVWRFETPDFVGCFMASHDAVPRTVYYGGGAAIPLQLRRER